MSAFTVGEITALVLLGGVAAAAVYFRGELVRAGGMTVAVRRRLLAACFTGGLVAMVGMGRVALAAPGPVAGVVATITAMAGASLALMCAYAALARRRVL